MEKEYLEKEKHEKEYLEKEKHEKENPHVYSSVLRYSQASSVLSKVPKETKVEKENSSPHLDDAILLH